MKTFKLLMLMICLSSVPAIASEERKESCENNAIIEQSDRNQEREQKSDRATSFLDKVSKKEEQQSQEENDSELQKKAFIPSYPGAIHTVYSIGIKTLELEDGSIWKLSSWDAPVVSNWLSTDMIVIEPNKGLSIYDYKICNLATGAKVRANLYVGPFVGGCYTNYINSINYEKGVVCMSDATFWDVSGFDQNILMMWLPGDPIIFGIQNSIFNPYILINPSTDNYVCASCEVMLCL